jgi:hypothetical protein
MGIPIKPSTNLTAKGAIAIKNGGHAQRKNDQAWIEQKNGAVVRRLLGYRRFQGLAAAQAITRLYGASRLFVNFFQPSFKLAEKHRQGAHVSKRYHPPQTPVSGCCRLRVSQRPRKPGCGKWPALWIH